MSDVKDVARRLKNWLPHNDFETKLRLDALALCDEVERLDGYRIRYVKMMNGIKLNDGSYNWKDVPKKLEAERDALADVLREMVDNDECKHSGFAECLRCEAGELLCKLEAGKVEE